MLLTTFPSKHSAVLEQQEHRVELESLEQWDHLGLPVWLEIPEYLEIQVRQDLNLT